jgi:hypothetical protein
MLYLLINKKRNEQFDISDTYFYITDIELLI